VSLYILEGPRNSGKTTVVNRLMTAYPKKAVSSIKFHRTTNPPLFMAEFLAKHYLALIDSRSICVLDRFHLTEFVMRSLDKKVPTSILIPTTHMIDTMLHYCGAITYIIETPVDVRMDRMKLRDLDHRKKEWPDYVELDNAWKTARKMFNKCKTKVVPGSNEKELDKIVLDIMVEQKSMTRLDTKIPFFAPRIEEEVKGEYDPTR